MDNPTMCKGTCFWCHQDNGLIWKMEGAHLNPNPTPKNAVFDYDPCAQCADVFDKGIAAIRVHTEETAPDYMKEEWAPYQKDPLCWPTGEIVLITDEYFKRAEVREVIGSAIADEIIEDRCAIIPFNDWTDMGLDRALEKLRG